MDAFNPLALSIGDTGIKERVRDMGDGSYAKVVSLPGLMPTALAANTAFDARNYGDVEFQFTSGTVTVSRSLNGSTYVSSWPIFDKSGASSNSAATPGIYSVRGGGYLQFSADVTVRGGN